LYAVIRAGGKQHRVAQGDVIRVERVGGDADEVSFEPIFVMDDDGNARAKAADLGGAVVTARVVGEVKGPKVVVRKFHNKTGYRRRAGHRQVYTSLEISGISAGSGRKTAASRRGGAGRQDKAEQEGTANGT